MKVAAAGATALLCLTLTGCADMTGEIDPEGHNGYDRQTCQDSKAMALDVMFGAASVRDTDRIQQIAAETKRAGDAEIRQASEALIASYRTANRQTLNAAIAALVKVCQL